MSDEYNAWIKSALGVDVGKTLKKIESAGSAAVAKVASPPAAPPAPAQQPASAAEGAEKAAAPSRGVLDRLKSTASNVGSAVKGGAAKALDAGNTAGKAVLRGQSAAWDGTKKAYGAVTGAYDKVAPNFDKSNETLGKLVDKAEAAAKKGNKMAADKVANVPVVGKVAKASAAVANATVDAVGGVVKGAGDLTAMAGNAIVHPIDAAGSMAEGALGIAEHGPMPPGVNTTVKAAHGLVDLARGKKDGEYGGNLKDLGKNLALNTKQDPKDPKKRKNADIDFLAGMGGGTDAWKEKPVEAAARTITNLAPMFMGDEGAGGKKPAPKGGPPVPEGPNAPRGVDPLGKTQVDPLGKTQVDPLGKTQPDLGKTQVDPLGKTQPDLGKTQVDPLGKTQPDLGKTQVDPLGKTQGDLGKTQVDPLGKTQLDGPPTEPDPAKGKPAKAADPVKNVIDVNAAEEASLKAGQKAAQKALMDATQEYVRYQQKMLDGDPSWNAGRAKELNDRANAAEQAWIKASRKLEAAQKTAVDPLAQTQRAPDPIRQNLVDADAASKAAQKANLEATQEYVRYRQKLFDKDPSWNAVEDKKLLDRANAAEQEWIKADRKLKAAQDAAKKAQGVGGSPRKK